MVDTACRNPTACSRNDYGICSCEFPTAPSRKEYQSMTQRAAVINQLAGDLFSQTLTPETEWRRGVCEAHSLFALEVQAAYHRLQLNRALIAKGQ